MNWYCFTSLWSNEKARLDLLDKHGAVEAWFPVRQRIVFRPAAKVKQVTIETPMASGYVLASFTSDPLWHEIWASRYIRGAIMSNGWPAIIPEAALMQMAQMPERLEAARQAEAERFTIRKRDRVRIKAGAWAGHTVTVTEIDGDTAFLDMFGLKGEATLQLLEKVL